MLKGGPVWLRGKKVRERNRERGTERKRERGTEREREKDKGQTNEKIDQH